MGPAVRIGVAPAAASESARAPRSGACPLPLEPIDRIARGMRLRDRAAGEALSPVVVVALRAGEIELTLPAVERCLPPPGALVPFDGERHAAGLARDVRGEREQLPALVGERRRLLPLGAAGVDLLFQVHRPSGSDLGIARGDALHVGVTAGARDAGPALLTVPQRFAIGEPEERRVGAVVVLHRARP